MAADTGAQRLPNRDPRAGELLTSGVLAAFRVVRKICRCSAGQPVSIPYEFIKMKAVQFDRGSPPTRLRYGEVEKPVPGEHEVLIRVHAVSLNAADYRSLAMGIIPKKKIFGADVAGRVESVGRKTSRFKPGDEVIGDLAKHGFGGLAEYVAAPEQAWIIKPKSISFEEAAALPMAALTALQALRDIAGVKKGQKVLIVGSSGGVGTFAVQLAKHYGAEVTGVCSAKNVQQTAALGADHVLDYTRVDFTARSERYDVILGINGHYPLRSYLKCLNPNGICVILGGSISQILKTLLFGRILSFGSKKIKLLTAKSSATDLELLANLLERGVIKPVIDRRHPLDEAVEAMNYLKQGHAAGKVVIRVAQE
jgi:NADPH:quinone reductase-like Zn-dependent oxidoreductase